MTYHNHAGNQEDRNKTEEVLIITLKNPWVFNPMFPLDLHEKKQKGVAMDK